MERFTHLYAMIKRLQNFKVHKMGKILWVTKFSFFENLITNIDKNIITINVTGLRKQGILYVTEFWKKNHPHGHI